MKNLFTPTTNVDIAHGHRSYQKFIGSSASNLPRIAMALSMIVVPLGLISLVLSIPNLNLIIGIAASIIAAPSGLGLAYVIEGMTIQACNRWIGKSKEMKILQDEKYAISDHLEELIDLVKFVKNEAKGRAAQGEIEKTKSQGEIEKTKRQIIHIDRKIKSIKKDILRNKIAAIGTSSVSFFAGGILWHLLFGFVSVAQFSDPLKYATESVLALLVPWVLIQSELGREETERTIRESISSSHYLIEAQQQDIVEHAVRELTGHHKKSVACISEHNAAIDEVADIQAKKAYSILALGEGRERQFDLLMKESESRKANQLAMEDAQSQKLIEAYIEGSVTTVPLEESQQPTLRILRNEATASSVAERNSKAKENRKTVEDLCDRYGVDGVSDNKEMALRESGLKRSTFYRIFKQIEQDRSTNLPQGA